MLSVVKMDTNLGTVKSNELSNLLPRMHHGCNQVLQHSAERRRQRQSTETCIHYEIEAASFELACHTSAMQSKTRRNDIVAPSSVLSSMHNRFLGQEAGLCVMNVDIFPQNQS